MSEKEESREKVVTHIPKFLTPCVAKLLNATVLYVTKYRGKQGRKEGGGAWELHDGEEEMGLREK